MRVDFHPDQVAVFRGGKRWMLGAVAAAVVGLVTTVTSWVFDPERTAYAYLAAFITCLSISLGALIFLAIVHAMNAKWPVAVRRVVEILVAPLPLLALAFIPIAVFVGDIYPWVQPVSGHLPHHVAELIEKKRPYLNAPFFWGRAAFYFVCWLAVAAGFHLWSKRQDHEPSSSAKVGARRLGAASLPLLALTLTFAAFDWVMSLEPAWFSTIFGIYVFAGGFVAGLGILTIAVTMAERGGWTRGLIFRSHYYALGRLLLAFTVFWAYIAFFQFMLIWIANRPEEVQWYIIRLEHGWQFLAAVIFILRFVLPFVTLLSYRIKQSGRPLSILAAIIVLGHWIETHWMVVPAGHFEWIVHWADLGAMLLVAGSCTAFAMWRMRGRFMAPRFDEALPKGVRYSSE